MGSRKAISSVRLFSSARATDECNARVPQRGQVLHRLANTMPIVNAKSLKQRCSGIDINAHHRHSTIPKEFDDRHLFAKGQDGCSFNTAFDHLAGCLLKQARIFGQGTKKNLVIVLYTKSDERLHDFRKKGLVISETIRPKTKLCRLLLSSKEPETVNFRFAKVKSVRKSRQRNAYVIVPDINTFLALCAQLGILQAELCPSQPVESYKRETYKRHNKAGAHGMRIGYVSHERRGDSSTDNRHYDER